MAPHPSRILVTGGAVFLGSHLCNRLVALGHQVTCLDNFCTGNEANIAHLRSKPNFTVLKHDVCDPIFLPVDKIYHLACPASPPYYHA